MSSYLAPAILWSAIALCAVAQVALLHSFFLGASRPARGASRAFRTTETLWVVLPALTLACLLAVTWRAVHAPAPAGPGGAPASAIGAEAGS
ncbi:MAG TPA: hypothetical protein VFS08_16335 [Gemmatimonadaceae bacterium]|nr:hypothetical protein [Gemmatimonadaceae bacterium]